MIMRSVWRNVAGNLPRCNMLTRQFVVRAGGTALEGRDRRIIAYGVGQAVAVSMARRKVRAPQGKVPGNAWGARAHGKCHRKYTA